MNVNQFINELTQWFDFSMHMVRNHPLVSVITVLVCFPICSKCDEARHRHNSYGYYGHSLREAGVLPSLNVKRSLRHLAY